MGAYSKDSGTVLRRIKISKKLETESYLATGLASGFRIEGQGNEEMKNEFQISALGIWIVGNLY